MKQGESDDMALAPSSASDRIARVSYGAVIILAGIWGASRVASSGDLWVALGCGRYILAHGVTRSDPFSFTSLPGTWVNQNWLSHVLFTLLRRSVGLTGLGIWKFLVSIAIGWLTASTARSLGAPRGLAALCAVAMAAMGRPFYDIRPNLHTILLSAITIRWLSGLSSRPPGRYWPVPLVFVLWANLHGGFLFGIVALFAASGTLATLRLLRRDEGTGWQALLLLPFLGLAATIISPYGITNLTHPYVITMGPDAAHWRNVKEWLPPYGLSAKGETGVRAFWVLTGAAGVIAILAVPRALKRGVAGPGRALLPPAAIALAGLLLSITSRRFIPLFSVAVIPVLAGFLVPLLPASDTAQNGSPGPGRTVRASAPSGRAANLRLPQQGIRGLLWPAVACLLAVAVCATVIPNLLLPNALWPASRGFGERLVRADEQPAEAARFLVSSGARGRVLTQWLWGGYLLYSEPFEDGRPRYRIYMDGRAQAAYPATVSKDLDAFQDAADAGDEPAVHAFLDHYQIDYCVIDRREEGVASILPGLDGWAGAYADDKSIIVARTEKIRDLAPGDFPDEAIRQASAAFALRTRGRLTAAELKEAFSHAVASVRARPTTTGVTEMTRIALAVPSPLGDSLRVAATRECDSVLEAAGTAATRHEFLSVQANTTRCRGALAQAAGDRERAGLLISKATELAREADRCARPYLR
jgi:hypothetical protein